MSPPPPNLASVDDLTLVRRAVAGDQLAAREFYDRHALVMLRLATARLQDQSAAEDVVYDAFERLWKAVRRDAVTPGTDGTLRGLLLTITHRRSLDVLRTAWNRRNDHSGNVPEGRDTTTPDSVVLHSEDHRAVYELIDDLAEPYRQIMLLTLAGHSVSEIAELTARRPNTVSQQRRRGFARTREAAVARGMIEAVRHEDTGRTVQRGEGQL